MNDAKSEQESEISANDDSLKMILRCAQALKRSFWELWREFPASLAEIHTDAEFWRKFTR